VQSDDTERASTGCAGLDNVLAGGLDADRLYLIEGRPGSGKTTIGLQFLLEGRRRGERVLYITMSESLRELELVARRHGWNLDGVDIFELVPAEIAVDPAQQITVLHPAEVELGETINSMFQRVEALNPTRVVIDSLSELRLLAQDSLRYRRQVLALKHFFSKRRCTVILLDDFSAAATDLQLHSIVHGSILLDQQAVDYGSQRRRLLVQKMRGLAFRSGYHDFEIRTGGLEVFPRLVAAEHHASYAPGAVASGSVELDQMLGGGLERGTNALIIGAAGVGKSSIGLTYATRAASRGEPTAYFAFDEGLGTVTARAESLGLPLRQVIDSGLFKLRQIDPAELSPGEFAAAVRASVERDKAQVIVLDSLNGYLSAMADGRFLILQMHELLSYLNQQGVLTLLILAQHGMVSPLAHAPVDISYLSDSVLLLRYFEHAGRVRRAISVVKKRSGIHEHTIRELTLSSSGVSVGPPLSAFEGILSGTPRYTGEEEPLLVMGA
jgi:circadian clock protein KaiC